MTTRLNNSMIMFHLIHSLLTNFNSMIAIEAKYVELCKYTVTYVGLNFLQRSSAVAEGPRNARRSDFICQSWRCVVWWFRCTLLWVRIARIGAFGSGGSLPLRQNFSWKGSAPTVLTIFGVVTERAQLSRWAARRAHGRESAIQPYVCVSSGKQRTFDNRCYFE